MPPFSVLPLQAFYKVNYENDSHCKLLLLLGKVSDGLTINAILENWSQLKPIIMKEWGEERDPLIDLFGRVRDEWLEKDLASWIGANRYNISLEFFFFFFVSR